VVSAPRNSAATTAWSRAGVVAGIVIILDQLTKQLLRSSLAVGAERHVLPGLTLVHTTNSGVAFSLLSGSADAVTVLALIGLALLLAFFARYREHAPLWLPVGLIAGGAVGNLIDRLRDGAVTDFIKLPDWPAFNLADSAITIGVVALILILGRGAAASPS
jgi:signal peptidase II